MSNEPGLVANIDPETIRLELDGVLPRVEQPARYLGLERNLVRKPWESVAVRMALLFPDTYEIGMSHQGSAILYHMINRRADALAERAYAPWPDMGSRLRETGIPLYTLESYRPVAAFDVVGITLQTELNYVNIPYVLSLAGIPVRAATRGESEPVVIGGGPCTANPEPVAPFFDALLAGDAEASLDGILSTVAEAKTAGTPRRDLLLRLSRIQGVYVPELYTFDPRTGWSAVEDAPLPVKRVWVPSLRPENQPEAPVVPFAGTIQDRLGMEIMRGCTQGCRFCQAGYWYRPVREHEPAIIVDRMERQVRETGLDEVGLLSLSSADYSRIESVATELAARLKPHHGSISLPSLRADAFSVSLAEAVSQVRRSGFTFAPEAGSDRLRRVINKTVSNDDVTEASRAAFAAGWNLVKLYVMIGLPTETDDDLEAIAELADTVVSAGRSERGGKAKVKVSVGCFVPKPWTPFQWSPFVGSEELARRIATLRRLFHGIRGAKLTWDEPEQAALEALLSRGSRRLADTIEAAHRRGAVFDGWSDQLNLDAWRGAIAETEVDLVRELGKRELEPPLPWDVIDAGVRKEFLRAELRRALHETVTPDCRTGPCLRCGIPGDGSDIQLATSTVAPRTSSAASRAPAGSASERRRYRFAFRKTGDARFLSHRQVMDALERAFRGARLPVRFTTGFNPHIRLSMGPALPLGHEGVREMFDVETTAPIGTGHLDSANRLLPRGLRLLDAERLLPGAPGLGKAIVSARNRIAPPEHAAWPPKPERLPPDLAAGVLAWELQPDRSLLVDLNLRQADGPTPGLKKVLLGTGFPADEIPLLRVVRERLTLRSPTAAPDLGESS